MIPCIVHREAHRSKEEKYKKGFQEIHLSGFALRKIKKSTKWVRCGNGLKKEHKSSVYISRQ